MWARARTRTDTNGHERARSGSDEHAQRRADSRAGDQEGEADGGNNGAGCGLTLVAMRVIARELFVSAQRPIAESGRGRIHTLCTPGPAVCKPSTDDILD